jgi:flagellum-specific peptidoglycan hydrolase FlgJ
VEVFPSVVTAAAVASNRKWHVSASVALAQWALESNYGRAMPPGSNNPFGIKAKAGEPFVLASTKEFIKGSWVTEQTKFRRFASLTEAFDAHGQLLATAASYARARLFSSDPNAFADALTGIYATDPHYGNKLKAIMKQYNLYKYDSLTWAAGPTA